VAGDRDAEPGSLSIGGLPRMIAVRPQFERAMEAVSRRYTLVL
jgi:hypothetical protein